MFNIFRSWRNCLMLRQITTNSPRSHNAALLRSVIHSVHTQNESHDCLNVNESIQIQVKSWLINAPCVFHQQRSVIFCLMWLQILLCHHHCSPLRTFHLLKKAFFCFKINLLTRQKMLKLMKTHFRRRLIWIMLLLLVTAEKHQHEQRCWVCEFGVRSR